MLAKNEDKALAKEQAFNGDKKSPVHFLFSYEKSFIKAVLPWLPLQISTVHLTLMTIGWSIGVVIAGYFSRGDVRWLWAFNGFVLLHYMTDTLDGAVGRARNSGLIKWGFYMDHFLDYIFVCAIIIGYSFLLPPSCFSLVLLCLTFAAGFMVHAIIDFAITNDFKVSWNWFGVSEMNGVLVLFNILLIFFGKALLVKVFPFIVLASFFGLFFLVYSSQKVYQYMDAKRQARGET